MANVINSDHSHEDQDAPVAMSNQQTTASVNDPTPGKDEGSGSGTSVATTS